MLFRERVQCCAITIPATFEIDPLAEINLPLFYRSCSQGKPHFDISRKLHYELSSDETKSENFLKNNELEYSGFRASQVSVSKVAGVTLDADLSQHCRTGSQPIEFTAYL